MAKHAYHEHLESIPLFRGLSEDELDAVARTATQLDYEAGKVLMREGGVAHEMFVVVDGRLSVTRDGEQIAEIGPGEFAGEMALLTHHHRNSTVTAATDISVIHIDGRAFSSLLHDVPRIAVKMLPVIAERCTAMAEHHTH